MLSNLFGVKVWSSGKVTCINGTTPHRKRGRKHGGLVEGNAVGDCLGGHVSD